MAWSALSGLSCDQHTPIKLTQEQGQEQKAFKDFEELQRDTSLIGASFTMQLQNTDGTFQTVHVTLSRPKASRIELTMDGSTFALEDGELEKIIDVQRHTKGIVLIGKTDLPLMTKGKAVVDKRELQKALRNLRDTKPDADPCLEVNADCDFVGMKTIRFSGERVPKGK